MSMLEVMLYGVEGTDVADLEADFDSGYEHREPALVLDLLVVDMSDKTKKNLTLVVPQSMGPELLINLLTSDQWEAVCNVY